MIEEEAEKRKNLFIPYCFTLSFFKSQQHTISVNHETRIPVIPKAGERRADAILHENTRDFFSTTT